MSELYFDDFEVGQVLTSSTSILDREDIIAFARRWDPLPIHLDDAEAIRAGFPGITASGTHLLAVKHRLLYDFGFEQTVLASFGFDEVRFKRPGRPGDLVHVRLEWVEKRVSSSRPYCGIAKHHSQLCTADGTCLLSLFDTVLIKMRGWQP